MSQATLAEMVGTTRARVSKFMNAFKKKGFVSYNGSLQINSDLSAPFCKIDRCPLSGGRRPSRWASRNWSKLTTLLYVEVCVTKELRPKQILAVRCPSCGAAPGEKCELSTGQPRTSPHRDRVNRQGSTVAQPVIPTRSSFSSECPAQKSIGKHGRGTALWVRDPLDVALHVYGLGFHQQTDRPSNLLVAGKYAGYFWKG